MLYVDVYVFLCMLNQKYVFFSITVINQEIKSNYLASPPIVVAYALVGNINIDILNNPIGKSSEGNNIYLKDLWPSSKEIKRIINGKTGSELIEEKSYSDYSTK